MHHSRARAFLNSSAEPVLGERRRPAKGLSPLFRVPQRHGKREGAKKCEDGRERRMLEQNSGDCGEYAADPREDQGIASIFVYWAPSHVWMALPGKRSPTAIACDCVRTKVADFSVN